MEIILFVLILGVMMVCVFILGGLFSRRLILDALDEARRERMTEDYYRLAGVRSESDPKPYVPPTIRPRAPRSRYLPHMNTLDRLLHEGKRGTIMVRAGDRNKKAC
jgi:hypothetical protein